MITPPYEIRNEYNLTEILGRFDSNYIFDIINDKLNNINYYNTLQEPNVVTSFEENFKLMNDNFPGDSDNIRIIREQVYTDIINILCQFYNLQFNEDDDTIDRFTLAYYLYNFLVSEKTIIMVNFYTSFIVNNKDSLVRILNLDEYKKSRESAAIYGKRMYNNNEYGVISANMTKVINHIATLDISLLNIFQSTYVNTMVVELLDRAIMDKGNFFNDYYNAAIQQPDVLPIIITNIRLELQKIVGNTAQSTMEELMVYGEQ